MSRTGVYLIRHASGVFYVGSTSHFINRRSGHAVALARNEHPNVKLQQAYNCEPNVVFEFYPTTDREEAYALEDDWIKNSWGNPLLANAVPYSRPSVGTMPQEMRDRIGKAHSGKTITEEHRQRISEANSGRSHSAETKAHMSALRKGVPKGPEWMDKITPRVKVEVDGVQYESLLDASKALGVTDVTVKRRALSAKPRFGSWKLITVDVVGQTKT